MGQFGDELADVLDTGRGRFLEDWAARWDQEKAPKSLMAKKVLW